MEVGRRVSSGKPRQKVWKPKVKTGCVTCRVRRIKCDEGKPTCARCSSSGRTCGGYHQNNGNKTQQPPELGTSWERHSWQHSWTPLAMLLTKNVRHCPTPYPPLLVFDSKVEGQSFDFFRSYSVPELTGLFRVDEEFWHLSVLQMSMTQPAVRYAVTGLGALHQKFSNGHDTAIPDDSTDSQIQFALRQCNRAIHALSDTAASREPVHEVATLMTCILFTCYATLQGHQTQSIMHFRNGMKLFRNLERSRRREPTTVTGPLPSTTTTSTQYDELYNAFVLAMTTLEIQARSLMYDEDLPAFITQSQTLWPVCRSENGKLRFKSLTDARCYFDSLLSDLQCFLLECDSRNEWTQVGARPRQSTMDQFDVLVRRQDMGKKAFEVLKDEQQTNYDDRDRKTILVIKMHNCVMDMYLSIFRLSSTYGDLVWDFFERTYREVVDLSYELLDCEDDKEDFSTMLLPLVKGKKITNTLLKSNGANTDGGEEVKMEEVVVEEVPDATSIVREPVNRPRPRPVFTFSQGVTGPLYTVASKCRDPKIRREAIVLLLRYPRREGLWDTFNGGRVSWEIMNLEEELAKQFHSSSETTNSQVQFEVKVAADVPVSCRVREVEVLMVGPRTATVRLKTVAESDRGEKGKHMKIMSW
ncbi:uncharacterized protein PV06_07632 [Exophiala oligosperma]|uniref:Zn(2)-C6 fungal-type domain-containing protein n=1 Tax=Exophiala oligosperma TaxID=215243 RepID=A0A0D2DDC3_9EURO|nr:uncharacterized protein PV06_07632 [Exophiala oligosperma]KIW40430.1 hypothetical protein PV06_07632 [Exophiala oligosperma]